MSETLLQRLVKYAYNTVPFYKSRYTELGVDPGTIINYEDLHKLPTISKNEIQKSPDNFLSSEYLYYPKRDNTLVLKTSGSTGQIMKVLWDKDDYMRSVASLWFKRHKAYDIQPLSKYCSFHSTIYVGNKLIEPKEVLSPPTGNVLSFSKLKLDSEHIRSYYDQILKFCPEWLFIPPSIAIMFVNYIEKNKLEVPKSLRYIELAGEFVTQNQRKAIQETFNVPVANMYGSMETNGIALECKYGHMHCLSDNVMVEVLRDGKPVKDGEEGEIYVTNLRNKAAPIIRYALGDKGILYSSKPCACGNTNPIIEVSAGRIGEHAIIEGKGEIDSYIFFYLIESINLQLNEPILQFQIIQEDYKKFTAWFVIKHSFAGWKDAIAQHFKDALIKQELASATWDIKFTENILPSPVSGKLLFFHNKVAVRQDAEV